MPFKFNAVTKKLDLVSLTSTISINVVQTVYAASTTNLNASYNNGAAGVGATLTNSGALAAFSLDGTSPPLNSRILIKDQTSNLENGVYLLTVVGSGAIAWVLTRDVEYDTPSSINATLVPVTNGTANANTSWLQSATVVTVGVSSIVYTQFTANPNTFLKVANNLSDVATVSTSRDNLGLGTASVVQFAKLGLGVAASNNLLSVNGSGAIGFPDTAAPVNGLIVNGNVSVGSATATSAFNVGSSAQFQVNSSGAVVSGSWTATVLTGQYGGTGVANTGLTINLSSGASGKVLASDVSGNATWVTLSSLGVTEIVGTSNQISASAAIGSVTLSLPNGLSLGSYQAIAPPVGGMIMPGNLGIGVSAPAAANLIQVGTTAPSLALVTSNGAGVLRLISNSSLNYIQSGLTGDSGTEVPLVFSNMLAETEWARFDDTGKFGIGTAEPQNKLDVNGSAVIGTYAGTFPGPTNGLAVSGSVAFGTATAAASALLTMSSTTQGFLPPVMTNTQRNAIGSPATGLTIYSSTDNDIEFYNGSSWIGASTSGVTSLTGTSNQITVSAATGAVTLSLPNGLSLGSYQATSPPTGGMIMPGNLGVGRSSLSGANLIELGSTGPALGLLTSDANGNLRFASTGGFNYIQSGLVQESNSAAPLIFTTILAGAEWARFDNTGKFGIGTTAPKNKLDVNGAVAIGSYAGVTTAASNSLIVSGGVAIGVAATSATAGTLQTAPPASSTVTTAFGSTLTLGTPIRNTTGYDIMVNITFNVSSYTSSDIVMGVGSSATPTTNTAIAADALLAIGTGIFTLVAYVPNNYYLLVDKGGTLTALNITIVAMAI